MNTNITTSSISTRRLNLEVFFVIEFIHNFLILYSRSIDIISVIKNIHLILKFLRGGIENIGFCLCMSGHTKCIITCAKYDIG